MRNENEKETQDNFLSAVILFCLCFIADFGIKDDFYETGDDEGLIVLSAAAGLRTLSLFSLFY